MSGHTGHPEACPGCSAPLAGDQRYCLNCGLRRAEARLPFMDVTERREAVAEAAPVPPPAARPSSAFALAGATIAALLIGLGVLIGAISSDKEIRTIQPAAAPVQKPPVINVTAGGSGGGETAGAEFQGDWPEGRKGYTVQLSTLPNDGSVPVSEVSSAKSDAEGKGAKDVGALNSDDFPSLKPGSYVVYSGAYTGKGAKAKAQAALKKLKKKFPKAKVIKVDAEGGGAAATGAKSSKTVDDKTLEDLQSSTGTEQQKKSARLPEELKLGGKPPPKDNKRPGGGSGGAVEIK